MIYLIQWALALKTLSDPTKPSFRGEIKCKTVFKLVLFCESIWLR